MCKPSDYSTKPSTAPSFSSTWKIRLGQFPLALHPVLPLPIPPSLHAAEARLWLLSQAQLHQFQPLSRMPLGEDLAVHPTALRPVPHSNWGSKLERARNSST